MNVNKNRLDELIDSAFSGAAYPCDVCLLDECPYKEYNPNDCKEAVMQYLQEFNVAEALEEGAHIVNNVVIFPPEEIPSQPNYGTPCEEVNRRGKADWWCEAAYCDYADCCPYL